MFLCISHSTSTPLETQLYRGETCNFVGSTPSPQRKPWSLFPHPSLPFLQAPVRQVSGQERCKYVAPRVASGANGAVGIVHGGARATCQSQDPQTKYQSVQNGCGPFLENQLLGGYPISRQTHMSDNGPVRHFWQTAPTFGPSLFKWALWQENNGERGLCSRFLPIKIGPSPTQFD